MVYVKGHLNNPKTPRILQLRDHAPGFEIPGNATDNNKYNYLIAVINHKYDTNFELLTICYDFIWRMPVERIYNHEFYLLQQSKRRKYIDKNFRNKS